ncbi:hypothetical protein D779_0463 [Imhoffiella purpurea]|uniref:Uncharacterized protein n=1 Tax=Imhoffiella purpurea TaxID=1249627 RepID=W9V968_9GAMM|nr:hypothetical protein D779_0463 [Imhoffiella purpurea]
MDEGEQIYGNRDWRVLQTNETVSLHPAQAVCGWREEAGIKT